MRSGLDELLRAWQGQVITPTNLEGEIISCLANNVAASIQSFTNAGIADFPVKPWNGAQVSALATPIKNRLIGLLGWTIKSLQMWTPASDPKGARLEGILIAVDHWTRCGNFWAATRYFLDQNRVLPLALAFVLSQRSGNLQILPGAPLWEREHLQSLQQAETAEDWVNLAELTAMFKIRRRLDCSATQALRGLLALDLPRLIGIIDRVARWTDASLLFTALPLDDALRLASASANNSFRFASLDALTTSVSNLPPSSSMALARLLIILAHDRQVWPAWIKVLNKYPVRNPHIQKALGYSLARSPDSALTSFVESVALTTPNADGRAQVAECLEVFRQQATAKRRQVLWRAAFDRWTQWNFGDGDEPSPTSNCELDYAVAGWLIEFADGQFIASEMSSFAYRLEILESRWNESLVKMVANYNRLLSTYRVVAFADYRRSTKGSWLLQQEMFFPPSANSTFMKARFRMK